MNPVDCPVCDGATRVIDTRPNRYLGLRRRRVCTECGFRFTTRETMELPEFELLLRAAYKRRQSA